MDGRSKAESIPTQEDKQKPRAAMDTLSNIHDDNQENANPEITRSKLDGMLDRVRNVVDDARALSREIAEKLAILREGVETLQRVANELFPPGEDAKEEDDEKNDKAEFLAMGLSGLDSLERRVEKTDQVASQAEELLRTNDETTPRASLEPLDEIMEESKELNAGEAPSSDDIAELEMPPPLNVADFPVGTFDKESETDIDARLTSEQKDIELQIESITEELQGVRQDIQDIESTPQGVKNRVSGFNDALRQAKQEEVLLMDRLQVQTDALEKNKRFIEVRKASQKQSDSNTETPSSTLQDSNDSPREVTHMNKFQDFKNEIAGISINNGFKALIEFAKILNENKALLNSMEMNSKGLIDPIENLIESIDNATNSSEVINVILKDFAENYLEEYPDKLNLQDKLTKIIQALGDQISIAEDNRVARAKTNEETVEEAVNPFSPEAMAEALQTLKEEQAAKVEKATSIRELADVIRTFPEIKIKEAFQENMLEEINTMLEKRIPIENIAWQFPVKHRIRNKMTELLQAYASEREKSDTEKRVAQCESIEDLSHLLEEKNIESKQLKEESDGSKQPIPASSLLMQAVNLIKDNSNIAIEALVKDIPKQAGFQEKAIELLANLRKILQEPTGSTQASEQPAFDPSKAQAIPIQEADDGGDDIVDVATPEQEPSSDTQTNSPEKSAPPTETLKEQTPENASTVDLNDQVQVTYETSAEEKAESDALFEKVTVDPAELRKNANNIDLYSPSKAEYIIASWITGEKVDHEIGQFTTQVRQIIGNLVPDYLEFLEKLETTEEIKKDLNYACHDQEVLNAIKQIKL